MIERMSRPNYLNIITFPLALNFKNEVFGKSRRVNLDGLSGTLYLPQPNLAGIKQDKRGLLAPKVKGIDLAIRVFEGNPVSEDRRIWWGDYFKWNTQDLGKTAVASVVRAVLSIPAEQAGNNYAVDDVGKKCLTAFPQWSGRLTVSVRLAKLQFVIGRQ